MEAELKKYISDFLKENPGINITKDGIETEEISGGWVSRIFIIKFPDNKSETKLEAIVKIYPDTYTDEKASKEFIIMKQLSDIGFKVPKVIKLELGRYVTGCPFLIMEKIEGRTLAELISELSYFDKAGAIKRCCRILEGIHRIDYKSFTDKSPFKYIDMDTGSIIRSKLNEAKRELTTGSVCIFDEILDWLDKQSANVKDNRLSFCHGDFNQSNIIIGNDGEDFVIDWTTADIDDSRFDIANFITSNDFELRKIIIRIYEKALGESIESIEFFEVYEAAKKLIIAFIANKEGISGVGLKQKSAEQIFSSEYVRNLYRTIKEFTSIRINTIETIFGGNV